MTAPDRKARTVGITPGTALTAGSAATVAAVAVMAADGTWWLQAAIVVASLGIAVAGLVLHQRAADQDLPGQVAGLTEDLADAFARLGETDKILDEVVGAVAVMHGDVVRGLRHLDAGRVPDNVERLVAARLAERVPMALPVGDGYRTTPAGLAVLAALGRRV